MVLFRPILSLCLLHLASGVVSAAPEAPGMTAAQVIAKARAAVADHPADLTNLRGVQMEFTASNLENKESAHFTLTLAAPQLRLLRTQDKDRQSESSVCAGRLEGWLARKNNALARRELKAVSYDEFKKMQDMASDDLGFFAAPTTGSATYRGVAEINGHQTHAIAYTYRSGFAVTRYFDAESFALVASDQNTPDGHKQRQLVAGTTKVAGLTFVAKESILIDGRKTGEMTYGKIEVNPTIDLHIFDFPSF